MNNKITTIGIIGGNGQVGTEISLYLSKMDNVQVIPFCRTEFGAAFLKRCGLEYRCGNLTNPNEAKALFQDCDLIADFTYLKGLPSEIKASSRSIITSAIINSPSSCKFVFASSMMAFGMGKHNIEFKSYLFARSVYGAMKRFSEKLAIDLGKIYKKEIYVLRLGQVHGELQSVSRKILNEIKDETTYIPDAPSYTVFPYTISEALVNIAQGKEKTGRYTLVSQPEWSWKEIHEYYCKKVNINPTIVLSDYSKSKDSNCLQRIAISIKSRMLNLANHYVEIIASYFLCYFPTLEKKLMAKFYMQKAKSQTREYKNNLTYYPYKNIHSGKILGERLQTITDNRIKMESLTKEVRELINNVLAL